MKALIGRRILKTGVSVFCTAIICHLLHLPPTFAVITAIVTTEPTAADSLKKGLIRLPAAAMGASFAVGTFFFFGQSALSYALVTMFTIIACSKLKLDTGTLVATLTAVAMLPDASDHLIIDFLTRISTTSIGILVSSFVNFFILPPKFGPLLVQKVEQLFKETADHFAEIVDIHLEEKHEKSGLNQRFSSYHYLHGELTKAYQLTRFQHDEWKYRRSTAFERRSFDYLQKKLDYLQLLLIHFGKMYHLRVNRPISREEKEKIKRSVSSVREVMHDHYHQLTTFHLSTNNVIKQLSEKQARQNCFVSQLCHELLSVNTVLQELSLITTDEHRFSLQETRYPSYIFTKANSLF